MGQIANRKYELIKAGLMPVHRSQNVRKFYQLRALQDIPKYGVKAGDLGGFVTSKKTLSHEGSCWIGNAAQVVGSYVRVKDNAFVGGHAVVRSLISNSLLDQVTLFISENASVTGEATVISKLHLFTYSIRDCFIKGNSIVTDKAYLYNVHVVSGNSTIAGSACFDKTKAIYDSSISGRVNVGCNVNISNSKLYDFATVKDNAIIDNSNVYGHAVVKDGEIIYKALTRDGINGKQGELSISNDFEALVSQPQNGGLTLAGSIKEDMPSPSMKVYREVLDDIDSYRSDIVKLIQYPVMTDQTDEYTLDMMLALKVAKRMEDQPDSDEFKDAVGVLEKAFMKAESNARKISATMFSDESRKKVVKARDLFRMASSEASSEQEKKVAFVQGFKQLEGVLDVPDIAVDMFRIKIGLPELEM